MSKLFERLDELEKVATPAPWKYNKLGLPVLPKGEVARFTDVRWVNGFITEENARLIAELRNAYPKLRAVVEAAEDFMNSDGDYFAWTEDERHCMSRLRDAVLALKEDV